MDLSKLEQAKSDYLYNSLKFGKYIEHLEKWKILRTSDLITLCNDTPQSTVRKHIKLMSDYGMIQSSIMMSCTKELTHILTDRFLSFSNSKLPVSSLFHEMTLNMFLISFKNTFSDIVDGIDLAHDSKEYSHKGVLEPDAVITLRTGFKNVIKIAVENEVSQKSENRFLNKVISYSNSNEFKYVFYLFPTKRIFNSYFTICERRPDAINIFPEKILFMSLPDLVDNKKGCMDADIFNPKYKTKLEKLISEAVNGKPNE